MTAKKPHHETKHDEPVADSPEVASAPEGTIATADVAVPVPRPTAVGGAGSIVSTPDAGDLAGIVAAASAHPGNVVIIVTNESDYSAVSRLLTGKHRYRRSVKTNPNQGVRAMWRAMGDA